MRVTRNYRDGMVNFRKNNKQTSDSLLQNLRRNSMSRRANSLANLLGGNRKSDASSSLFDRNPVASAASAAKSQKFYYDMQYHAKQVGEYADALQSSKKDSLYDAARESGSTEEIVANIQGFVRQYNNMLDDLKESGSRADTAFLMQFNSLSGAAEQKMAETGITRASDGTLVIDEEKLKAADIDMLEKVWGGSGFVSRAGAKAGSVEAAAERNIEAEKSSIYSPFDRSNLYGSSKNSVGNYFNYRR